MPDRVQDIRQRLESARDLAWSVTAIERGGWFIETEESRAGLDYPSAEDAEFIAHAPDDIAFLLAEVERLQEDLEVTREALDEAAGDLHNWQEAYYDDIHSD